MNEQIIAELRRLEDSRGRLTEAAVIEAARSPSSPLHSSFTWNREDARRKCHMQEARDLIRRYKIRVTVQDITVRVPVYVRDTTQEGGEPGYRRTQNVARSRTNSRAALQYALQCAHGHMERALALADQFNRVEDVATILRSLETLQGCIEEHVAPRRGRRAA